MIFLNKIVVVTGAGGGVGQQLVWQLLEQGAKVAAVDINEEALEKTRNGAGSQKANISIHKADITDEARIALLPQQIIDYHKKIDILINNAGIIQPFITLSKLDDSFIERIMNINFFGMLNMVRAFLPFLAERKEAHICNVSSMGGFLPVPGQSIYGASKAAVKIATEGLKIELSQTSIGVSLVIPGGIETDIKKNSGLEEEKNNTEEKNSSGLKLTSPEEAAKTILTGIRKNKFKILIGKDACFMDFLYRLAPNKASSLLGKIMSKNHGGILDTQKGLTR